jgi:ubiquinol-cytochrome c reductase iron-sulfur subunit
MKRVNSVVPVTAADQQRRKIALIAVGVTGSAGLLATAVPFVASLQPSALARAEGGPVDVEFGALPAGEMKTVAWRGQPVWIMRRTPAMITALQQPDPALADAMSARSEQPADCVNATRSVRPELFVAIGICTHLGCSPTLQLDNPALNAELHAPGGYLCPCHGSRFDLAGRVVKNVPAPTNLVIPPYRLTGASTLVVG